MFDPTRDERFQCPLTSEWHRVLNRNIEDYEVVMAGDEIQLFTVCETSGYFGVYTAIDSDILIFKGRFEKRSKAEETYRDWCAA